MDNWNLIACSDINRVLKVKTDLTDIKKEQFPFLITITHTYATADDILFPEPATLAFFAGFEESTLYKLDQAYYVAQDIDTGLVQIHIYSNNYKHTIAQTIEYFKLKPEFHVDFKVIGDKNWKILDKLSLGESIAKHN